MSSSSRTPRSDASAYRAGMATPRPRQTAVDVHVRKLAQRFLEDRQLFRREGEAAVGENHRHHGRRCRRALPTTGGRSGGLRHHPPRRRRGIPARRCRSGRVPLLPAAASDPVPRRASSSGARACQNRDATTSGISTKSRAAASQAKALAAPTTPARTESTMCAAA